MSYFLDKLFPEIRNEGGGHSHVNGDNRIKADEKTALFGINHASANILYIAQKCFDQ